MALTVNAAPVADQKTRELLIYIADKLKTKSNYGATLLNKVLYFIDNISYQKSQKPVSSFTYVKQEFGPTPDPAQYLMVRDSLLATSELTEFRVEKLGKTQKRYINNRKADLQFFDKEEIVLIDAVLSEIGDASATEISDFTHTFMSWRFAKLKEELPFHTYLLTSKAASDADLAWAKSSISATEAALCYN